MPAANLYRVATSTDAKALKKDSFTELRPALDHLSAAATRLKKEIVDVCSHTALANCSVTLQEAEFLRAVAATLPCPLLPFLPRIKVARHTVTETCGTKPLRNVAAMY